MARKHYLLILLVTLAGLGVSYLLWPRPQEIALMQMKDKYFEQAREAYEAQLAEGRLNIEIATRLSELYLQTGEIDKAIGVMERFIAQEPEHIEARRMLGTYYQYAQRQDDYLRNLEEINRLSPQAQNLGQLADIYNFNTQFDKQAQTLQKVVTLKPDAQAEQYADLAALYASKGEYAKAIETLRALQQMHPQSFTAAQEQMLVSLLLDNRQPQDAAAEAAAWIKAHPEQADANAQLISMVQYRASPKEARALMDLYSAEQLEANPQLQETSLLLMLGEGREDEAYAQLRKLHAQEHLTPELHKQLLMLSLARRDSALARELAQEAPLNAYSENELALLLELGLSQQERWLPELLSSRLDAGLDRPVFSAMLATARRSGDAAAKLDALAQADLQTPQLLQIARICTRAGDEACARRFLSRLPQAESIDEATALGAAEIYIELRDYESAQSLLNTLPADTGSARAGQLQARIAAARGDVAKLQAYFDAQPEPLAPRMISDLYFSAANAKQWKAATVIAEFGHRQANSAESRSRLAYAYLQNGKNAQAAQLLRENQPLGEDDENNYLAALGKLAKTDDTARRELAHYVESRLRSGLPAKRKTAMVYTLIALKETDLAMPYIRELAMQEGGQWATLYAETLDKQGKHDEARQFWIKLAAQASTSAAQKRAIAYTLLNNGYKNDALPVFRALAQKAAPESEAVKELLFLWGPRPEPDAMAWLENRYLKAPTEEKAAWAALIAERSTPEALAAFMDRNPESSRHPQLLAAYFEAQAASGRLAQQGASLRHDAEERGDTAWLREYARVARANSMPGEARNAYEALIMLDPTDDMPLAEAGTLAYGQADYSLARTYLAQYAESPSAQSPEASPAAFFYYAETLRRDKRLQEAAPYYTRAIELIDARAPSAENQSVKAQSQIGLGHVKEGLATFEAAVKTYPGDEILRADQASALLDLKRYDDARSVLAAPMQTAPLRGPVAAELALPPVGDGVHSYSLMRNDTELLVHFNGSRRPAALQPQALQALPWIAGISEGYDTLLVTAREGYRLQISKLGEQPSLRAVADESGGNDKQIQLRRELQLARADLETGHVYAASRRLNALLPAYPNDAQLLGMTANAENYGGNWPQAQMLLGDARAIAPENEDVQSFDRDMRRLNAPNAKLDHEWVKRGDSNEQITTLSGFSRVSRDIIVGAIIQNNVADAENIRRADGRTGNFSGTRQNAELYALHHWENGQRARLAFYMNNDTFGLGGAYSFLNPLGETTLSAELDKPYWEYIEAVLDDATRDRLAISHTIKPRPDVTLTLTPSYNRYNVDGQDDVLSTAGAEFEAVYRLLDEQPFLAVAYGLDAEYQLDQKKSTDALGDFTRLFPLRTRELHALSLNGAYDFDDDTYGELLLGYGYDRFGGNGPIVEARLTHEFTDHLDAQIRGYFGVDNDNTDDSLSRLGGYVRWRF